MRSDSAQTSAGRPASRRVAAAVLGLTLAGASAFTLVHALHRNSPAHGNGAALPKLWAVPAFAWADQDQRLVSNQTLQGRVWIGDFIFTRCTTVCPLLTGKMTLLRRSIEHPGVRFVSFSVDPQHDTPAVLKEYAGRWGGAPNWILVQTDTATIAGFAQAMSAPVRQMDDAQNPILHSDKFFLVDQDGWVRGIYDSNDAAAVQQLVAAAAALAHGAGNVPEPALVAAPGAGAVPEDGAAQGMVLYHELGCAGCHENPQVAPPLAGIAARHARPDGRLSPADGAAIRQSILDPEAEIRLGYATSMPSYRGQVTDAEVAQLVAYIATLRGDGATAAEAALAHHAADAGDAVQVIDPVCKMSVFARAGNNPFEYQGRTYYFCSGFCGERFRQAPESYLKSN